MFSNEYVKQRMAKAEKLKEEELILMDIILKEILELLIFWKKMKMFLNLKIEEMKQENLQ